MIKKKDSDKMPVPVGANNHSPVQAPGVPVDEFHGMGGSYILDPETGTRIRVEGPKPDQAPAAQESEKMEAIDNESE